MDVLSIRERQLPQCPGRGAGRRMVARVRCHAAGIVAGRMGQSQRVTQFVRGNSLAFAALRPRVPASVVSIVKGDARTRDAVVARGYFCKSAPPGISVCCQDQDGSGVWQDIVGAHRGFPHLQAQPRLHTIPGLNRRTDGTNPVFARTAHHGDDAGCVINRPRGRRCKGCRSVVVLVPTPSPVLRGRDGREKDATQQANDHRPARQHRFLPYGVRQFHSHHIGRNVPVNGMVP